MKCPGRDHDRHTESCIQESLIDRVQNALSALETLESEMHGGKCHCGLGKFCVFSLSRKLLRGESMDNEELMSAGDVLAALFYGHIENSEAQRSFEEFLSSALQPKEVPMSVFIGRPGRNRN